jgi:opacity protein-like surface antigen
MKNIQARRKAMKTRRGQRKVLSLVFGMCILFPSLGLGKIKDLQIKSCEDWRAIAKDFHLARDSVFTLSTGLADEKTTNETKGKIAMEVSAGMARYTSRHYGTGFRYGLGLLTDLSKRVALEFLLERYTVSVEEEAEELGAGKLQVTPVLFNLHLRFSADKPLTPYALIGVGFYFFHFQPEDLEEGKEQEEDLVDRFSLLFGGGAEYLVSRKLAFLAELRYCLVKTWVQPIGEIDVDPDEQTKISPNSLVLSLGIRYYF